MKRIFQVLTSGAPMASLQARRALLLLLLLEDDESESEEFALLLLMVAALLVATVATRVDAEAHEDWGGSRPGKRHRIERFQSYAHPSVGVRMRPGIVIQARFEHWMGLPARECRKRMRVTGPVANMLRDGPDSIRERLEPRPGHFDDALTGWQKICVALYGMGSRGERRIHAEDVFAMAESTVRSCVRQFTSACREHLKDRFVKFNVPLIDAAAREGGDDGHLGCFGSLDGRKFQTR